MQSLGAHNAAAAILIIAPQRAIFGLVSARLNFQILGMIGGTQPGPRLCPCGASLSRPLARWHEKRRQPTISIPVVNRSPPYLSAKLVSIPNLKLITREVPNINNRPRRLLQATSHKPPIIVSSASSCLPGRSSRSQRPLLSAAEQCIMYFLIP